MEMEKEDSFIYKVIKIECEYATEEKSSNFFVKVYDKSSSKQIAKILADPYKGLCTLEVWHDYKRMGIATKLLNMYIDHTKKTTTLKFIKFICSDTNSAAISLYKKMGFTMIVFDSKLGQLQCILDLEPKKENENKNENKN